MNTLKRVMNIMYKVKNKINTEKNYIIYEVADIFPF